MERILKLVKNLLLTTLILLIGLSLWSQFRKTPRDYILGLAPVKVLSGTMAPEIETGDMVIARKVDPETIEKTDIIAYRTDSNAKVAQRVVEVVSEEGISFKTKGNLDGIQEAHIVLPKDLVGKQILTIPKFAYVMDFITEPLGFVLLCIVPVIIILGKEVIYAMK